MQDNYCNHISNNEKIYKLTILWGDGSICDSNGIEVEVDLLLRSGYDALVTGKLLNRESSATASSGTGGSLYENNSEKARHEQMNFATVENIPRSQQKVTYLVMALTYP